MRSAVVRRATWGAVVCVALIASLLVGATPAQAASGLGPSLRVKGVSDGDTIKVRLKGRTERVRLIGIDTPELGRDGAADQCHAREAKRQMKKLVQGKRVRLKRDSTQANRDKYGRLLRYVYTAKGRRDVGKVLINRGHGREYTYRNRKYKHRSSYRAAERRARKAGRGLWSSCDDDSSDDGSTTPPGACVIKGNIASSGEKIYHVPGQQHYDETVVTTSKGERWFCTETEAVEAGWRRSKV